MSDYLSEKHTFLGEKLYLLVLKCARFLGSQIWLWVVLNLTWGILGTLIGLLTALVVTLLPIKKKYTRERMVIRITYGDNWGGLSGVFFILVADNMGDEWTEHTIKHEIGHTFQNAVLGPLYPFIVIIPSVVRYQILNFRSKRGKPNPPYDGVWFEASATDAGTEFFELS